MGESMMSLKRSLMLIGRAVVAVEKKSDASTAALSAYVENITTDISTSSRGVSECDTDEPWIYRDQVD